MGKKREINQGWVISLIAWIVSSVAIPFLPEIISRKSVLGYPLMEYVATIGLFAGIFLLVWIPVGMKAAKRFELKGLREALSLVVMSFLLLAAFCLFVFTFLWNS